MRSVAVAAWMGILLLESCAGAPSRTEDRLLAQIEQFAALPGCRLAVLMQARALADPRLAEIGWQYRDDEDPVTRVYAWDLALLSPQHRVERILQGLASEDHLIRRQCVEAAGESVESADEAIDQALAVLMAEEPDGLTTLAAFRSYVRRNGRAGARRVYEVVHARGAGWLPYAAAALALHPDEQFLDVFRAAAADGVCQRDGRRGLSRLGRLADETWIADEKRHGEEKSLEEYRDAYDAVAARLTGMRRGSIAEMIREAADARIVILSEIHYDGFVRAWEIGILQQLVHLWGGPRRTRLLYESETVQGPLVAAAGELGCRAIACEQGLGSGMNGGPVQAWNLEKRDAEAIGSILEHAADAEVRDVVAYGALHTTHIQEALRARGVPTVRIVLSPDPTMRAGAMRVMGSLKTLGNAFRYDDGTWFVDVCPYSRWGCAELDAKLGEEGR